MPNRNKVQVFPEGQGFIAVRSDRPSLSAYGETRDAAIEELQLVLDLAREISEEDGGLPTIE